MASTINIKIAPLPRGEYSSSATYAKLDVVSYNGSSYMAIKAVPTGTAPTNTTYWQLLVDNSVPDGAITTAKLADGAVTDAKLAQSGGVLEEVHDIRISAYDTVYASAGDAVRGQISSILTGEKTPVYLYRFTDFKTDVPTWNGYAESDFTITDDAVTIGASAQHFIYKRHFFDYAANSNISVKVKLRIDSYSGGTNGQQLRITASGYSSSNVLKDVGVDKTGTTVTYNNVNYAMGDVIDVDFAFTNVAINNAYIGFNNKNNNNMPALEWSLLGFDVYYTLADGTVKVMYSQYADKLAKRYEGKTWGAVGDSLTAPYYDVYVSYVASALGLTATNYGVGGTTLAHVDGSNTSMVDRVCGPNEQTGYTDNFDLWTIFGGINDAYGSVPIGSISDSTETTFYGALNLICENLLERTNHPTIALIAPYNAKSVSEDAYITAIEAIGAKYSLPVLNLNLVSGINSLTWDYYLRDSVHPSQAGANKLRPIILEWFERLRLSETTPNMPH